MLCGHSVGNKILCMKKKERGQDLVPVCRYRGGVVEVIRQGRRAFSPVVMTRRLPCMCLLLFTFSGGWDGCVVSLLVDACLDDDRTN